jgi:iron-sulfur cluster repair protein YtfE (RIC family)
METDTHLHIHKENNVLFPALVDAERRLVTI